MMKPLLFSVLVLAASGPVFASDTDPLDFDYQIVARAAERPALIFNDGLATYIQPRPGQKVEADGAVQSGPYWVVDGVPDTVRYSANGQPVVARWKRANGFTSEPSNPQGDMSPSLAEISGRLALIGPHSNVPLVREGRATLPLAQLVKTIAPVGWSGTAQKDIALTDDVSVDLRSGENWLQALARVLDKRNLYAEVDFVRRNIALRGTPPKAFALDAAVPGSQGGVLTVSAPPAAADAGASAKAGPEGPAIKDELTLASAFDAIAIRDAKNGRIEVRFSEEPKDLVLRDAGGKTIWTTWDDTAKVLSLPTVDRFTVMGRGKAVEVTRVPSVSYLFAKDNSAGLERVFEKDNATYLSFVKSKATISVFDENHEGGGEQKDRYYKFNRIVPHMTVMADGNIVQVDRLQEVWFEERAGSVL